jgi:hypothetical protein
MTERVVMTNSETGAFRTCEKRWEFAYEHQIRPVVKARALTEGAAIHEGRDAIYREVQRLQREGLAWDGERIVQAARHAVHAYLDERLAVATERAHFTPEVDDLRAESEESAKKALVALALHVEHQVRLDFDGYRVLAVEQEFNVPVPNEAGNLRSRLWLRGKIDLVLEDKMTGEVILNECKSTAGDAATADLRLDVDSQVRAYTFACRHIYGSSAKGRVHLDVLRKQAPNWPHTNKDGTVSVAACDTTRAIYLDALEAQERPEWLLKAERAVRDAEASIGAHDPADPKAVKRVQRALEKANASYAQQAARWQKLKAKQRAFADTLPVRMDRWASRHEHHVSDAALREWRLELHATARVLRDVRAKRRLAVRNPASCIRPGGSCAYRTICVEDTPERRDAFYERVPHRHPELDGYEEEVEDLA